jgi:hypothetical protein
LRTARNSTIRFLTCVEAEVVGVEDAARLGDLDAIRLGLSPRQLDQPVEVGAQHRVLGRSRRTCAPGAAVPCCACFSPLPRASAASAIALRSASISTLLPLSPSPSSFWIDFNLLAQQVFALALVDARLGALVDLARQPQHFQAPLSRQSRTTSSRCVRSMVSRTSWRSAA